MKYRAVIERDSDAATCIAVPDDVVGQLDSGQRPKVVITIGPHSFPTTVEPSGDGYLVRLAEDDRDAAGVQLGDYVTIDIELDRASREADASADLDRAH